MGVISEPTGPRRCSGISNGPGSFNSSVPGSATARAFVFHVQCGRKPWLE
jgi:hypothetical protein